MDYESSDSRSKGCWDPAALLTPFYEKWTSETATPDFVVDEVWCGMVGSVGFGAFATEESGAFWKQTLQEVYRGDEGRKKVRMALNCLIERDGLLLRLRDIQCPVYWLQVSPITLSNCTITLLRQRLTVQGTDDTPFGTTVAKEQINRFTRSREARLQMVEGGCHYLNATHPEPVNRAMLDMVQKHASL